MARPSATLFLCRVCMALLACAAIHRALGADGDLVGSPFVIDSTSRVPTIVSSPAVAADGTVYVSVQYSLSSSYLGAVFALTPTSGGLQRKWPPRTFTETIEASPTIGRDGTIYIGVDDGRVYALDKETGADKSAPFNANDLSPDGVATIESTAALSPDGQTLYVGLELLNGNKLTGGVVALTTSLKQRWFVPLPAIVTAAPAVASDGTVYVGCWDGGLYAIAPDGSSKWRRELGAQVDVPPAIGRDGTIYIGNAVHFEAIAPNGSLRWERSDIATKAGAAVGADNTVYVGNYLESFSLYALRGSNGETRWRYVSRSEPTVSVPAIRADGVVIYAGFDGRVRAFSSDGPAHSGNAGDLLWEAAPTNRSPFDGSPAISPVDNTIWIGARSGNVFGIKSDYPISQYASWPMFQHDPMHTGIAPAAGGGGRLVNLSSRALVGPATEFIAGLYAAGPGAKTALMRAVGPTLTVFGVANAMPDPSLSVHISDVFSPPPNDNWEEADDANYTRAVAAAVGAFPLPHGSKDAAMVLEVDPRLAVAGQYSMIVGSPHGDTGVALAEIYDADPLDSPTRLVNLSTRGYVGAGEDVLIAGFMIRGGTLPLLIRAVGPSLAAFGVPDTVKRPVVTVQDRAGNVVATNTGWGNIPQAAPYNALDLEFVGAALGAFGIPKGSADSALLVTLQPDQLYTIKVTGVDGATGNAIVEIYDASFQ